MAKSTPKEGFALYGQRSMAPLNPAETHATRPYKAGGFLMQPLSPRMEAALAAVIARERLLKDHNSPDPYARSSARFG